MFYKLKKKHMKKYFTILIMLSLNSIHAYCQFGSSYMNEDNTAKTWLLDDIPNWILENIKFPPEALKYGISGIEQVCISATWDGKVFITSGLNTLNPAFEKEIMDVVSRAPKCIFTGSKPEDIYKYMWVDFSKYISKDLQHNLQFISLHTPPRLSYSPGMFNGRENFIKWIYSTYKVPKQIKQMGYTDTITLNYTVSSKGHLVNAYVTCCEDHSMKEELERTLKKSPSWNPAIANKTEPIDVSICDKMIIEIDNNGNKLPFRAYLDEVFCNSSTVPDSPDMMVFNPQIKPKFRGEKSFISSITKELTIKQKTNIAGSFIIEKDGKVSNISISQLPDEESSRILEEAIMRSEWTPAEQGGIPVKTCYTFGATKSPRKNYQTNYDIYGKYFIMLQADPTKIHYKYTQSDGSELNFPFNSSGSFDYNVYYKGMMDYYKKSPFRAGNVSKRYFNKIYKLYVK